MFKEPLPPALQGRAFRRGEAARLGIGDSRLRRQGLHRPTHGLFTPTAPSGLVERCRDLLLLLPDDAAFSHETAAALLGLPLPPRPERDDLIHVMTMTTTAQRRRVGWVGHRGGERRGIVHIDGIPAIGPIDTWCDLGTYAVGRQPSVSLADLVMIGDAVLMRLLDLQHAMASESERRRAEVSELLLGQIRRTLTRRVRPRGKTVLVAALELMRVGVRSPQESRARVMVVRSGLPEPAINVAIRRESDGLFLAEGDLVWDRIDARGRRRRVVGEYQGIHHAARHQRSLDSSRAEALRDDGWTVHEIWAEDVNESVRRWTLVRRLARSLGLCPSTLTQVRWL